VPFRSTKAAVKMHTLLDLRGAIPAFIHVSDGKLGDVTRAKRGMDARRVYSSATDRATGVICDQRIALNGFYVSKDYPEHLRRVKFNDPESGKTLVFLTNNMTLPPLTIAALYKSRWQVELFFKWIKPHLRIKRFLATSENAVKTQIWCAVSTYVLIAIVKKELRLDASLVHLSTDFVGLNF
jgi:IS4 transposase